MSAAKESSVLAIGIDAAESTLVKRLIEQNEMPTLKGLLDHGQWLSVRSPATIGSGTVWPTFMTGLDPAVHGTYSEWRWQPEVMALSRYRGLSLTPFWKTQPLKNVPVGIFDVPYALPTGVSEGFEVCEWWAHDSTGAGLQGGPKEILSLVKRSPAHPLSDTRFVNATPNIQGDLKALTAACIEGVRLRAALARTLIKETSPRLSLVVFPEIHSASHQMWHTVDPHLPIYAGRKFEMREPLLAELYREVDRQIGTLIDSRAKDDVILVFTLHGFRPASGFPAFLAPLLIERGYSRIKDWGSQPWRDRSLSLFAAMKRHAPVNLKKLYYKLAPIKTTHNLALPTMLPRYDWANTRAFSLPADQYGWIRINLVGRESQGCVLLNQYEETCEQVKKLLLSLTDDNDQRLVRDIVSTAANAEQALSNPLPDLVVHWEDAAFGWPLKIRDSKVQVPPHSRRSTGQHATEGFCIYRGKDNGGLNGVIAAKDLGRLIAASL